MKNIWTSAYCLCRISLTALLVVLLSACVFPRQADVQVTTYLLSIETPGEPASMQDGEGKGTLLVGVPLARSGFDTRRMGYMLRPHELRYFATSQWADAPARMLAPLFVEAFEHTGTWQAVVRMPSVVPGDYRVDVDNLVLRQEFFDRPSQVRVQARVQMIDLRRQCVLGTEEFEALTATPSDDAYGGVLAANQAVASLLKQVADWLSGSRKNRQSCRP